MSEAIAAAKIGKELLTRSAESLFGVTPETAQGGFRNILKEITEAVKHQAEDTYDGGAKLIRENIGNIGPIKRFVEAFKIWWANRRNQLKTLAEHLKPTADDATPTATTAAPATEKAATETATTGNAYGVPDARISEVLTARRAANAEAQSSSRSVYGVGDYVEAMKTAPSEQASYITARDAKPASDAWQAAMNQHVRPSVKVVRTNITPSVIPHLGNLKQELQTLETSLPDHLKGSLQEVINARSKKEAGHKLLSLADHIERAALESNSPEVAAQFFQLLEKQGIHRFKPEVYSPFAQDAFHAIGTMHTNNAASLGRIDEVVYSGYKDAQGHILQPARGIVYEKSQPRL